MEIMNQKFKNCPVMTPQISFYEIEKFRLDAKHLIVERVEKWPLFAILEEVFPDQFFKSCVLNLDNEPNIDFSDMAGHEESMMELKTIQPSRTYQVSDFEDFTENLGNQGMEEKDNRVGDILDKDKEVGSMELLEYFNKASPQEKRIIKYLKEHPLVEEYRQQRISYLNNELVNIKFVKCDTVIRDDGIIAKCVITDQGDKLLIRHLDGEAKITSRNLSSNW